MLKILRQPRYLGLFGLMLVLATICGIAGTWQIYRFEQKHSANHHLRADDRDTPVSITAALGPAAAPTSDGQANKFRHITATGTYLPARQSLLRGQTIDNDVGYLVITPLKTPDGVLLVARGFIAQTGAAETSPTVPAAPSGQVTVTARLQPADHKADRFGKLPGIQVDGIDPAAQASRIGAPVWNGYAELLTGEPGTASLKVIPSPDLSNPAGGAEEPQHAAYVVQWYLFGILALAAPFILAAAERRRDADPDEPASRQATPAPTQDRKSKKASLDDRLAGKA
ncbi:MAG: SURF1 family protein [Actinomycetota bacterium]|nr:SURF1 family protein [Actinomycetota bacterium]MDQ2957854.1 SURF1 family protein [Actinomycetota bacterium]